MIDWTIFILSINGFLVIEVDNPSLGLSFQFPTFIQDQSPIADVLQAFASLNVGDFNNDGQNDLIALIGGTAFYFNSAFGAFDPTTPANPFANTLAISDDSYVFDTVGDLNGDRSTTWSSFAWTEAPPCSMAGRTGSAPGPAPLLRSGLRRRRG